MSTFRAETKPEAIRGGDSKRPWHGGVVPKSFDVVRKLLTGDVDIGIVGYDMLREIGNEDEDLVIVHDALGFMVPFSRGGAAGVGERELVEPIGNQTRDFPRRDRCEWSRRT